MAEEIQNPQEDRKSGRFDFRENLIPTLLTISGILLAIVEFTLYFRPVASETYRDNVRYVVLEIRPNTVAETESGQKVTLDGKDSPFSITGEDPSYWEVAPGIKELPEVLYIKKSQYEDPWWLSLLPFIAGGLLIFALDTKILTISKPKMEILGRKEFNTATLETGWFVDFTVTWSPRISLGGNFVPGLIRLVNFRRLPDATKKRLIDNLVAQTANAYTREIKHLKLKEADTGILVFSQGINKLLERGAYEALPDGMRQAVLALGMAVDYVTFTVDWGPEAVAKMEAKEERDEAQEVHVTPLPDGNSVISNISPQVPPLGVGQVIDILEECMAMGIVPSKIGVDGKREPTITVDGSTLAVIIAAWTQVKKLGLEEKQTEVASRQADADTIRAKADVIRAEALRQFALSGATRQGGAGLSDMGETMAKMTLLQPVGKS